MCVCVVCVCGVCVCVCVCACVCVCVCMCVVCVCVERERVKKPCTFPGTHQQYTAPMLSIASLYEVTEGGSPKVWFHIIRTATDRYIFPWQAF